MADLPTELTASALVLRPGRRVLLIRHRKLGVWLYPGGHVESNETPDEAAVRETREETGVAAAHIGSRPAGLDDDAADVRALFTPYLVMCEFIQDPARPHYHLDLIYLCAGDGTRPAAGDGADAVGYFDEVQAAELPMFPAFRRLLERVYRDDAAWAVVSRREGRA